MSHGVVDIACTMTDVIVVAQVAAAAAAADTSMTWLSVDVLLVHKVRSIS